MSETIELGAYLWTRVREIGIKSVYGVPGDFELTLLDLIPGAGLDWIGTSNELVAAYAADGYARINGMGALVTTFGPGELSALNGIAGAYGECVPVLHVVGYPSTKVRTNNLMVHHTMGEGRFDAYHEMSKHISCATTVLWSEENAVEEIDGVIRAMIQHSRPGYIGVPTDMVNRRVPTAKLKNKLTVERDFSQYAGAVVTQIKQRILAAKKPAILVDGGAIRHRVTETVSQLIDLLGTPFFTTLMGKGSISEVHSYYGGLYAGAMSEEGPKEYIENADCVVKIGNFPSDLNTGVFTESYQAHALIDIRQDCVILGNKTYPGNIQFVLSNLLHSFRSSPTGSIPLWTRCHRLAQREMIESTDKITFDWLLQKFSHFFRPGDLVVLETGSVSIGISQTPLPKDVHMFSQILWGSIGYASGAAVGAFTAAKEQTGRFKRHILITGDGSAQMTIQAVGDLVRLGLDPIIIVLNNDGYTCERFINGPEASYNDITDWNWQTILSTLGPSKSTRSVRAATRSEVNDLFGDWEVEAPQCTHLIEIILDKHDCPRNMKQLGAVMSQRNWSQSN